MKGNAASSTRQPETAELEPGQAETAEDAEAKAHAGALPLSQSLSSGGVQRRQGEARNGARVRSTRSLLGVDESAAQRDRLIADMAQLQSSDEAADWVHKNMPVEQRVTVAAAQLLQRPSAAPPAVIEAKCSRAKARPHRRWSTAEQS